jgi:hypothetical protein
MLAPIMRSTFNLPELPPVLSYAKERRRRRATQSTADMAGCQRLEGGSVPLNTGRNAPPIAERAGCTRQHSTNKMTRNNEDVDLGIFGKTVQRNSS